MDMDDSARKELEIVTPEEADQNLYQKVSQNLGEAGFEDDSKSVSPHTADKPVLEVVPKLGESLAEGF